jgi:iron complex transport system ATP-binding protein
LHQPILNNSRPKHDAIEPAAIAVENVSVSLSGVKILNDLNFLLPQGAFVAIIGPNGAGKSTLLKTIIRIIKSKGNIVVNGRALAARSQREIAQCFSYVPQDSTNALPFSVEEIVMMARYPSAGRFRLLRDSDQELVDSALKLTGTEKFRERRFSSLSGGERQKVLLAAAIAQGSEILLLDEPGSFLDPRFEGEIFDLLGRLHASGKTIVLVTHDINRASLVSTHVLALKDGVIPFFGTTSEFLESGVLPVLFGTEFVFVPHPTCGTPMMVPVK